MIQQAVILVGGEGHRLNDMVRFAPAIETPKPLMEVGGKPFVTYAINMLKGVGFLDIVLIVGYRKEEYDFLKESKRVRLWETRPNVDEAVLSIPGLQDMFLILNGDCFPIMDWHRLYTADHGLTTVKICDRDAGCAVVRKSDLVNGVISVTNIGGMSNIYPQMTILGGLHIGTPQGLQRARVFMDTVVFGQ
jgi:NDP-sugar pyrophosphorylase family protein